MQPHEISDASIDSLLNELNRGKSGSEDRLQLDEGRRNAIKSYDNIQACPGSGKTTLVGLKLLLLSNQWHERHCGICVLTHSNVAKGEVIARLGLHPTGRNLLSYPHFVGTIQDFINTFLALPYARSRGWDVRLFDSEEFGEMVETLQGWGKVHDRASNNKYYFASYFKSKKIPPDAFRLEHADGNLSVSAEFLALVDKYIDRTKSVLAADYFLKKREALCTSGAFQYSEMYALARQVIHDNADVVPALRRRFHVTILDEMQDTQKHQDELINLIFPADRCKVQKFGDPDQSIFDSMGNGLPNISYNDAALVPISESHRFSPDIALKITGLSYRRLAQITTSRPARTDCPPNSIFLYEAATISKVLPAFAALALQLPVECRCTVKVVGGIGKPATGTALTLHSYCPDYDAKAHVTAFHPRTLCHAVRFCSELGSGDIADRYQILRDSILELMRKANRRHKNRAGKIAYFSRTTLTRYLRDCDRHLAFGALLAEWVMMPFPTADKWDADIARLIAIVELGTIGEKANEFAAYEAISVPTDEGPSPRSQNVYCGVDGIEIGMSTIHGVKGETHSATLVCETRYNKWCDVQEMLEFLCDPDAARPVYDPEHPKTKDSVRATFMKRLYVAMSRPRFLLCLATHKDHVNPHQLEHLSKVAGWQIINV
jgi:DNA helicase-2/ATP-dependent DNA helicase PcrA